MWTCAENISVPQHGGGAWHAGVGYMKVDDLRRLLHGLGAGLPQWLVKELTSNVTDLARRGRTDRVYYRDLTDVEIKDGDATERDVEAAPDTSAS